MSRGDLRASKVGIIGSMMNIRNQLLTAVAIIGVSATHAHAQGDFYNRDKYEAVRDRIQPDFDPEPVRLGAFIVDSSLNLGAALNDNVLASNGDTPATAEEEDTIVDLGVDVPKFSQRRNTSLREKRGEA